MTFGCAVLLIGGLSVRSLFALARLLGAFQGAPSCRESVGASDIAAHVAPDIVVAVFGEFGRDLDSVNNVAHLCVNFHSTPPLSNRLVTGSAKPD